MKLEPHDQDSDCTLDENQVCVVCLVDHSGQCPSCEGHGFHKPDCEETK